ncbi:hypothetical protein ACVWDG_09905, partial [Escherichia coli]
MVVYPRWRGEHWQNKHRGRIGRHEHFPIHMRTHLIENLKQPVIQSDDHAYPLKKRLSGGC